MNDKIKWFGRYLGCNVIGEDGRIQKIKMGSYGDFSKIKLILKELKDISDEDLHSVGDIYGAETVNKENYLKGWHNTTVEVVGLIEEIDFLRSKGYAIGIPREYYITESELKEDEQ